MIRKMTDSLGMGGAADLPSKLRTICGQRGFFWPEGIRFRTGKLAWKAVFGLQGDLDSLDIEIPKGTYARAAYHVFQALREEKLQNRKLQGRFFGSLMKIDEFAILLTPGYVDGNKRSIADQDSAGCLLRMENYDAGDVRDLGSYSWRRRKDTSIGIVDSLLSYVGRSYLERKKDVAQHFGIATTDKDSGVEIDDGKTHDYCTMQRLCTVPREFNNAHEIEEAFRIGGQLRADILVQVGILLLNVHFKPKKISIDIGHNFRDSSNQHFAPRLMEVVVAAIMRAYGEEFGSSLAVEYSVREEEEIGPVGNALAQCLGFSIAVAKKAWPYVRSLILILLWGSFVVQLAMLLTWTYIAALLAASFLVMFGYRSLVRISPWLGPRFDAFMDSRITHAGFIGVAMLMGFLTCGIIAPLILLASILLFLVPAIDREFYREVGRESREIEDEMFLYFRSKKRTQAQLPEHCECIVNRGRCRYYLRKFVLVVPRAWGRTFIRQLKKQHLDYASLKGKSAAIVRGRWISRIWEGRKEGTEESTALAVQSE